MKIIVFSGLSRTGKSTAIRSLAEDFLKQGLRVKVYEESAQMYLDVHTPPIDRYDFQKFIVETEKQRIKELLDAKKEGQYDIVLVDRTFADMYVYIYRSILQGEIGNTDILSDLKEYLEISKEIYDEILFFDTMIKEDKNFDDYNLPEFKQIFVQSLHVIYGKKLKNYPNNIKFQKDVDIWLKRYIDN